MESIERRRTLFGKPIESTRRELQVGARERIGHGFESDRIEVTAKGRAVLVEGYSTSLERVLGNRTFWTRNVDQSVLDGVNQRTRGKVFGKVYCFKPLK